MNFSFKPFVKYVTQQLITQILMTLLSNFLIKRTKNFENLKSKIEQYNKELDSFKTQLCPSEQQQHIDYITKELEKASASISGASMRSKILTFVVGFVVSRIIGSSLKGVVFLRCPFPLPGIFRKLAQKGLVNADEYAMSVTAVGFLFNQSIKAVIARLISVKLPKLKAGGFGLAKKMFNLNSEETDQMSSMMNWFQ